MLHNRSVRFFLATVVVIVVLLFLPQTGWLMRQQVQIVAGQPLPGMRAGSALSLPLDNRESEVVARRPSDFDLQLAAALEPSPGAPDRQAVNGIRSETVRRLLPLTARFGDNPTLCAAILRGLEAGDLVLNRPEADGLQPTAAHEKRTTLPGGPPGPQPTDAAGRALVTQMARDRAKEAAKKNSPEAVRLALEMADRGAALDPNNAYFPAMRAGVLFGQHRDAEGIAALHDAAALPVWNDYSTVAPLARWDLEQEVYGHTSAMSDMVILALSAADGFPVEARLRAIARLAAVLAAVREHSGNHDGGLAIRLSVAKIGAKMGAQSPNLIGSMVGDAITAIAFGSYDGAPPMDTHLPSATRQKIREARESAYLVRIGHPEVLKWLSVEQSAEKSRKRIISADLNNLTIGMDTIVRLALLWAGGLLLILSTGWLLVLGGIAGLLQRAADRRAARDERFDEFPSLWQRFGSGLWPVVGLLILVALVGCSVALPAHGLTGTESLFHNIPDDDTPDASATEAMQAALAVFVGTAGVLLAPAVLAIVLFIRSLIRHLPIRAGVRSGFRTLALPIAGFMLLVYGLLIGFTAQQEYAEEARWRRILVAEGPYYAKLAGETWPGESKVPVDLHPAPLR